MILATVGTQLPFDRMIGALDRWAASNPAEKIIAQTGRTRQTYHHLDCQPFLAPSAFQQIVEQARVIVSHAGMGSILTAVELGKPIIIVPRRLELMEHRTDHQLATAAEMDGLPNVTVADSETLLAAALNDLLTMSTTGPAVEISAFADRDLISEVSGFVRGKSQ